MSSSERCLDGRILLLPASGGITERGPFRPASPPNLLKDSGFLGGGQRFTGVLRAGTARAPMAVPRCALSRLLPQVGVGETRFGSSLKFALHYLEKVVV